MNVDGAVSSECLASCGGVIRNSEGNWLRGFSRNLGNFSTQNAFVAELLAIATAIDVMISLDYHQVIIESDSLEVVELLEQRDVCEHHFEYIARDIQRKRDDHGSLLVQYTPREGNSVADYLAKVGLELSFGTHWFEAPFGDCIRLLERAKCSSTSQSPVIAHR